MLCLILPPAGNSPRQPWPGHRREGHWSPVWTWAQASAAFTGLHFPVLLPRDSQKVASHWSYSPVSRKEVGKKLLGFLHIGAENRTAVHPHQQHSQAASVHEFSHIYRWQSPLAQFHYCPNTYRSLAGYGCEEGVRRRYTYICVPGVSGQGWASCRVQGPLKRLVTPQDQQVPVAVNTAAF